MGNRSPTKRSVLTLSAKIFDPIGSITPFTIHMKVLFQLLCSSDNDSDDELTPEVSLWWNQLLADINVLKNIQVPRGYISCRKVDPVGHDHANGDIEVNLVASKA